MVYQKTLNGSNGAPRTPRREVAVHSAAFAGDLFMLAELQWRLLLVDLRQSRSQGLCALALLTCGAALAFACLPVALMTVAYLLAEYTSLSTGQAFLTALVGGLLAAAAVLAWARQLWRTQANPIERSQQEFFRNLAWVKSMLTRLGSVREGARPSFEDEASDVTQGAEEHAIFH